LATANGNANLRVASIRSGTASALYCESLASLFEPEAAGQKLYSNSVVDMLSEAFVVNTIRHGMCQKSLKFRLASGLPPSVERKRMRT